MQNRRNLTLSTIGIMALAGSVLATLIVAPRLRAQTDRSEPQWQIAAGRQAKFDVASVKQNVSQGLPKTNVSLNFLDAGAPNVGFLSAVDMALSTYIGFAYKLTPSQTEIAQQSLPKWANSERFDIEAQADGRPSRDQMRLMMQALLAERSKLVAHFEKRELPVFAVTLDKPGKFGPRLVHLSSDGPCE